jgi:hypothetical protein
LLTRFSYQPRSQCSVRTVSPALAHRLQMSLAPVRPTPRLSMDYLRRLLRGLYPSFRWAAWGSPMRSPRLRYFWRRMTRVLSRAVNSSLMAAERKSREPLRLLPRLNTTLSGTVSPRLCTRDSRYLYDVLRFQRNAGSPRMRIARDAFEPIAAAIQAVASTNRSG